MSGQRFYADPRYTFTWFNGAIGHRTGSSLDCLGPYAKVRNCPVEGAARRYTCYATAIADTYFSIPAVTEIKGKRVVGYFTMEDKGVVFRPLNAYKHLIGPPARQPGLTGQPGPSISREEYLNTGEQK